MSPIENFRRALPVLALGVLLAASGCSKKTSSSTTTVPPPAADAQAAPTSAQSASPQPGQQPAAIQADGQPDLDALNRAMVRWLVGHRRVPANFDEFAATAGVTIPPPPSGKKYAIAKNMHVILVNQ
jgi:hypothetical protein